MKREVRDEIVRNGESEKEKRGNIEGKRYR